MANLGRVLLTAVLYYAAARFGLLLAFERTNVSPVWPPSGIAFALMLLLGRSVWPGILLGASLSNLAVFIQNLPASPLSLVSVSVAIAAGNTLEALAGQRLLESAGTGSRWASTVEGLFRFLLAAMAMCLIAATVGTASLAAGGITEHVSSGTVWVTWWLGDLIGILVLTPLIVIWSRLSLKDRPPGPAVEAIGLGFVLVIAAAFGFGALDPTGAGYPLIFLTIPPLVWAAIRFGPPGASAAVVIVSGIALWSTVNGRGPFAAGSINESLLLVQAYVGVLAITHLALAAAAAERQAAHEALRAAGAVLEQRVAERTAVAEHQAEELRRLTAELALTERRERRNLSRVLHDHVQQLLVAAQFRIAGLKRAAGTTDGMLKQAEKASDLVSQALTSLRDLTVRLSPPILQDRGLPGAVEWLAREMQERHGLFVTAAVQGCERLPEATRLFAFDAIQELLFNVVKHSGSASASVHVAQRADGSLEVRVEDQGSGFDAAPGHRRGLGLFSVQERLLSLGGTMTVDSAPGRGTRVRLAIPSGRDPAAAVPAPRF